MVSSVIISRLRFVVVAAANVFVGGRQGCCWLARLEGCSFEAKLEDGFDVAVACTARVRGGESTRAGTLESRDAVAIAEAEHSEDRSIREFRSHVALKHSLDHELDVGAER
jgi:hypothetical protein